MNIVLQDPINKEKDNCLWEFHQFYNDKYIEGIFSETKENVRKAIGKKVDLSEYLNEEQNKIYTILKEEDFELLSENPIDAYNTIGCAFNPLDYINCYCENCGNEFYIGEYDFEKCLCKYCMEDKDWYEKIQRP